jgi:hypothetical protein
MEKRPLFVLLALLLAGGVFAQAYTWTDENGVIHFSDRPHPDAETIQLDRSSEPRPQPTTSAPSTIEKEERKPILRATYSLLEIVSPSEEETLWNIETILNVNLDLEPRLRAGHQVRVYIDGMPQIFTSTSFQMKDVYRGAHTIQAEVIASTGVSLIRSNPRRFFVQQNSIR